MNEKVRGRREGQGSELGHGEKWGGEKGGKKREVQVEEIGRRGEEKRNRR